MTPPTATFVVIFLVWAAALGVALAGWAKAARRADAWETHAQAWRRLARFYQAIHEASGYYSAAKEPEPVVLE